MPPCVHPDRAAEFHACDERITPMYERTSVLCDTQPTRQTAKRLKRKAVRRSAGDAIAEQLAEISEEQIALDFEETERMAQAERDAEDDAMRAIEEEAFAERQLRRDMGLPDWAETPFDCGGAAAGCAYCIEIERGDYPYDPYGTTFEEGLR